MIIDEEIPLAVIEQLALAFISNEVLKMKNTQ